MKKIVPALFLLVFGLIAMPEPADAARVGIFVGGGGCCWGGYPPGWGGYGYPSYAYGYPSYYVAPPPVAYIPPPVVYAQPSYVYSQPAYSAPDPAYAQQPAYTPPPQSTPAAAPQPQASGGFIDSKGRTCKAYQTTAKIDGNDLPVSGTACLQPDGTWRIVR